MKPAARCPEQRFVLLGASNLALGLPTILRRLRADVPGPMTVLAARGHGRSYGTPSRVLLRGLPGICDCGLWSALSDLGADASGDAPTRALVTDIGNDLVYGATPSTLLRWVEECLDRLERAGARTLVTQLPVASLRRLSRVRYEIARRVLFPSHPLAFARMLALVEETDERVADLARRRGLEVVAMEAAWYGVDPVHFRVTRRAVAWRGILSSWGRRDPAIEARPPFRSPRRAKPAQWSFAGRERRCPQPARRGRDSSELWLF